ncbi:MAG: hypothetical protein IJN87_03030 [Firmicutes bacterium]|nr:hypothetical protein [Bacillota bacterium]
MKESRSKILVWIVVMLVIAGVSAGCGQEKRKEKYEVQSNMEETSEVWHHISGDRDGNSRKAEECSKAKGVGKAQVDSSPEESNESQEDSAVDETEKEDTGTSANEYWTAETSPVTHLDDQSEESKSTGESAEGESKPESESELKPESKSESKTESKPESKPDKQEIVEPQPYYLTQTDKGEVIAQLIMLGESYGLTYYPNVTESETWDSPTPIYEEELILGREYVMSAMVEYTEGAFVLMQMEGCSGFALSIKEAPETVTDAYYEVYVYWM